MGLVVAAQNIVSSLLLTGNCDPFPLALNCVRCDTPQARTAHKETAPEFPLTGDKQPSETAQDFDRSTASSKSLRS
jgi:hypothetical protein